MTTRHLTGCCPEALYNVSVNCFVRPLKMVFLEVRLSFAKHKTSWKQLTGLFSSTQIVPGLSSSYLDVSMA